MMKQRILASLVVLFSACASQRAMEPLRYSVTDGVLQFEHSGSTYVVTDAATVARVQQAADDLGRATLALQRESRPTRMTPREQFDRDYASTTASRGIPPAQTPEDREEAASTRNDSMAFADYTAEQQTRIRSLQDDATRADRRLRKLLDHAVSLDKAQRVAETRH
jgi:hypothetical protein